MYSAIFAIRLTPPKITPPKTKIKIMPNVSRLVPNAF